MGFKRHLHCLALGIAGATALLAPQAARAAGTWAALVNQPSFNACMPELMTDGSVFVQAYHQDPSCWKLVPDANGNYVNGTWVHLASMHDWRLYYASSVLNDGRIIAIGGEYSSGGSWTNHGEIYNPLTNVWTSIAPPPGWSNVGDAPCMVLPNGKFFLGSDFDARTAIYDPVANSWVAGPNMPNPNADEATFTLLPENTVLQVEAFGHPGASKYNIATNTWVSAGNTNGDLVDPSSLETGGDALMPDGSVFCMGATPRSSIYHLGSLPTDPGSWTAGPVPPTVNGVRLVAADAPLANLPNGKVLLSMSPYQPGGFGSPAYMCEYDGTSILRVPDPGNNNNNAYNTRMCLLPTGQVMFTSSSNRVYIYTPDGTYNSAWQPTITSAPAAVVQGTSYPLSGTQLNGISLGTSYGDDAWNPTNYPLVRITNNGSGHVFYCRTFGHSTMGVATGSAIVSTNFQVPNTAENGASTLVVVANGIPSQPQAIVVGANTSVTPDSFSLFRGILVSGGLSDLFTSDNSYLVVRKGMVLNNNEGPIQLIVSGTSSTLAPSTFQFVAEAHVSTPNLQQTISLFNFQTNAYEDVDVRNATQADSVATVNPSGDLSRFVNQSTHEVRARIAYIPNGPVISASYTASFDQTVWNIS